MKTNTFRILILLFIAAACLFAQSLSWHGVEYRDDEIFYYKSTQEMHEQGNYLSPTYFGEDRFQKPILFYWLIILAYKILGVSWFSARIISVIFASWAVCLTWDMARRIFDIRIATLSSVVLMTVPLFFRHAKNAVPDMALNFFIVLALYYAVRFILDQDCRRHAVLFFVACGLGFMIKGFAALIVPMLTMAIFCLWTKKRDVLAKMNFPLGIGIVLGIVLPWFLYMIFVHGEGYANYMLVQETQNRLVAGGNTNAIVKLFSTMGTNCLFYLGVIWNYFAPWSLFAAIGIPLTMIGLRKSPEKREGLLFLLIWFFVVFIFFCIVHFKISHYVLVLTTPFSILVSYFMLEVIPQRQWRMNLSKAFFAVLLVLSFLAWMFLHVFLGGGSVLFLPVYLAVMGVLLAIMIKGKDPIRAPLIIGIFIIFVLSQTRIMVDIGLAGHTTLQKFASTINQEITQTGLIGVGSHDLHEKEFQAYFDKKCKKVANSSPEQSLQMISKLLSSEEEVYCLIMASDFEKHRNALKKYQVDIIQEEYIFRKRLQLNKGFLTALLRLDREKIHEYFMEKVFLIKKDAHA